VLRKGEGDDAERMVGDVNLFLNDRDDVTNAEIEIMIADEPDRRKGYAKEALLLMMNYGVQQLKITRFYAKINETNVASIKLFLSLGYNEVNYVQAFSEYEYELRVEDCMKEIIQQQTVDALYTVYDDE
jgi:RimJ/RimL family protein N-acetyltransferase